MANTLIDIIDSKPILLSLVRYKQALKAVHPPADITDARIALAYMTFLVDQLVLLIKLVEKREKEKRSNQKMNATPTIQVQFLTEICQRLAISEQNPNISINILETRSDINYRRASTTTTRLTELERDQPEQSGLITLITIKDQLVSELNKEILDPEKKWNKVKLIAGIIAAILFFTAIIMLVATHSYTLPYIIIMATFAATGILAPFIGLPFKSGQLSLLDYIFFNPSAKQIQRCIDDINYPMFEGKKECKMLANTTKSSDNSVLITGIFAQKSNSSTRSLQELVEEEYQTISRQAY